ncbi:hypothetical protein CC1G_03573 [Coprinopsis cinerea okayama7|uniref:Uncharacterized protein n=1 Tax=Coprinopsis cinerea (strain Okayama-7 / 130 / ATCC MYA-4618 / FGSC 9003) TaxID=240176 RepID=A8NCL5_COPC7|nr:hypothetical protein CC1G_03573 [Coprinopsis cinerea okayama7\|eukprot:XP_001832559.1 hypothetical protein CC1G_03573 [Coprinopsis cinerea okayama7\
MSGINNPYAQGGWVNPQNPYSINDPRGSGAPPPSIYGALPYSQSQGPPRFVEFQFTGLNPDVLNCIVMGPNARHCYTIATSPASSNSPSVTGIRNDRGVVVAKIEWYQRPSVEAPEFLPKQYAGQWMPLSNDMR